MPPWFIRFPAKVKPGMQRSVKESIPAKNFWAKVDTGIPAPMK